MTYSTSDTAQFTKLAAMLLLLALLPVASSARHLTQDAKQGDVAMEGETPRARPASVLGVLLRRYLNPMCH